MTNILKLNTINIDNISSSSAIYFLYYNCELQYIGKSRVIFDRLNRHEIIYDEARILLVPDYILDRIEILLIIQHKPKYNECIYPMTTISFSKNEIETLNRIGIETKNFREYNFPDRYAFSTKINNEETNDSL